MRESLSAQAVLSVSDFKQKTAETLKRLQEVGPHILTQNGRSAGILLSPHDFDTMRKTILELGGIVDGMSDVIAGRTHDHSEVKAMMEERFKQRSAG